MGPRSVFLIVVTDIDGTLLDHDTYSFAAAKPALTLLRREGVPLILCSSKTRAEIEILQRELGIAHPFVSENGGALFVPVDYFPFRLPGARRVNGYHAIEFGRPYEEVVNELHRLAAALGVTVTGFSDMSDGEIASTCHLPAERARLAKLREYDEPFSVAGGDPALRLRLCRCLEDAGLHCTTGGRFDHVTGAADKAVAIGLLRMLYRRALASAPDGGSAVRGVAQEGGFWQPEIRRRRIVTVALGDAPNDVALLREVEIPVIVRSVDARQTEHLIVQVPYARVSRGRGASGWSETVQEVVRSVLSRNQDAGIVQEPGTQIEGA